MEFAQLCDLVQPAPIESIDTTALTGTWINSNPDATGIARIVVSESGGKLSLRVFAVGKDDGLIDWGPADLAIFSASPSSRGPAGFTSHYDFGFAEATMQGMIMKGLLVLAQFHQFKDQSGRSDYFVREYFASEHGKF